MLTPKALSLVRQESAERRKIMAQLSFFDLADEFGLEIKKEEPKKEVKKASKKSTSKVPDFVLPCKVNIPYHGEYEVKVEGKEKLSQSELLEQIATAFPWLGSKSSISVKKEGNAVNAYPTTYGFALKGNAQNTKATVAFGEVTFEVSTEEKELSYEVISAAIRERFSLDDSIKVELANANNTYLPKFSGPQVSLTENTDEPVDEDEEPEQTEVLAFPCEYYVAGKADKLVAKDAEMMSKAIKTLMGETFVFSVLKADKVALVVPNLKEPMSTTPSKPKETAFDIHEGDWQLSLKFVRLPIKPEDFGGKDKVNKDDLIAFLQKNGYFEFVADNSQFEVIPGLHVIDAGTSSSTKGCY